MSNLINRDKKKRKLYLKNELKRLQYKTIITDSSIPNDIRYHYIQKLNQLSRNSSSVRVKNRCILTGRGHSVYNFCKLSRIKFRELAAQGHLMGITKSSW
jgi:small subunit ribosomal protein S14